MENKSIQEVEILLVQCDNSIYADEVTDALFASGITSYRHDEKQYGHHGAHGPNEGIAIYVSKDNYDQAAKIVSIIESQRKAQSVCWCPKCGSENIVSITPYLKHRTAVSMFILFSLLIAGCYFLTPLSNVFSSPTVSMLMIAILLIALILFILGASKRCNMNRRCKDCGHRFCR